MASSRLERIGTIFTRKNCNENLINNLSKLKTQVETDYNVMKDNEHKLENLTSAFMKCIQQVTASYNHKLTTLEDIQTAFKKDVEGLLLRGAMKPDDRPLWFDVYRAFPPLEEPKYARPMPEIKPIKSILYKEDVIRAKFHAQGHGKAAINFFSQNNDTQIKRLVQQYETLKANGVAEEELVEKAANAVGIERKEQIDSIKAEKSKEHNINPQSVTGQILVEADIKNIFKE